MGRNNILISSAIFLVCISSIIKAQDDCSQDSVTFERITGINSPLSQFVMDELLLTQNETHSITWQNDCYRLCKTKPKCSGFFVDYIENSCRLLSDWTPTATTEHTTTLQNTGSYFEKICIRASSCSQQWIFDRIINMELVNNDDKILTNISSKLQCQRHCLNEKEFSCRSAEYNYDKQICLLSRNDRRSLPEAFKKSNENVDYFENQCISVPSKCLFRRRSHAILKNAMMATVSNIVNEISCQEECSDYKEFNCRSFIYNQSSKQCYLSPDDKWNVEKTAKDDQNGSNYYEKVECLDVTMKCDASTMTAILTLEYPFQGKVYAMSNPEDCLTHGDIYSNEVVMTLPLKSPLCGTKFLGNGTYTNSIIIQRHPTILRSSDRRVDVICEYEEHKVRLKAGKHILEPDVTNISSVVTGIAPTPEVRLRLVDANGNDATGVDLGTYVFLRIELLDQGIYGIMGTNLLAKSGDGSESIALIDEKGCPVETSVFPNLQKIPGSKSLEAPFQAFRFASDSTVRFQVTVSFCLNECNPTYCDTYDMGNVTSYGRKRRSAKQSGDFVGLKQGNVVSDIVMEGALTVRAKLERKDISEMDTHKSASSTDITTDNGERQQYCTSSSVVIAASLLAVLIQIAIASACIYISFGRGQSHNSTTNSRTSTLINFPKKTKLQDLYYNPTSKHNSLAGYMH